VPKIKIASLGKALAMKTAFKKARSQTTVVGMENGNAQTGIDAHHTLG